MSQHRIVAKMTRARVGGWWKHIGALGRWLEVTRGVGRRHGERRCGESVDGWEKEELVEMLLEGQIRREGEWDGSTGEHQNPKSGSKATSVVFVLGPYAARLEDISGGSQGCQVLG